MVNPHSAQLTVVQRRVEAARREKAKEEDELQVSLARGPLERFQALNMSEAVVIEVPVF